MGCLYIAPCFFADNRQMSSLGNTSALYEKLKYYNNIGLETGYLKQHFTLGTMPRDLGETSAPARQKKPVSTGASGYTFNNEIISCPRAIVIHQDCFMATFCIFKMQVANHHTLYLTEGQVENYEHWIGLLRSCANIISRNGKGLSCIILFQI